MGAKGYQGWYVCTSMNHCICVKCFFRTRTTKDTDNVTFPPKHVKFLAANSADFLHQEAINIISLLTKPPSLKTPSLVAGDTTRNVSLQVAEALQRYTEPPPAPDPPVQTQSPVQLPRVEVPQLKTE